MTTQELVAPSEGVQEPLEVVAKKTMAAQAQPETEAAEAVAEEIKEEEVTVDEPASEEPKEGSSSAKASDAETEEAEAEEKEEKEEEEEEVERIKDVWVVRIPRVDVDQSKLRALEAELNGLNKQVNVLNAVIRVRRVEKEGAFQRTNAARDKLKVSSAASREKIGELAPYREKVKLQNEQMRAMKGIGRDLQCKTEEELLRKIEGMELAIAHGSMSLNDEKEMVKKIKKLNMQKESIKKYDINKEALEETKQEVDEFRDYLKTLNSELDILKFRENGHREVFLGHKEEEDKISEALNELFKERNELKASSDECYERVKKERARCRKLIAEFSKSRQTKKDVQRLVEETKYDEAIHLAKTSVESWFEHKWNADQSYREKYVSNMTKHRYKKASIEEIESELNEGNNEGKKKKSGKAEKVMERPEDVVAALLRQAHEEWVEESKQQAKIAAAASVPSTERDDTAAEEGDAKESSEGDRTATAPAVEEKKKPKKQQPKEKKASQEVVTTTTTTTTSAEKSVAKPRIQYQAAKPVEIDESIVGRFELPSVVKEILSDAQKPTETVKYYQQEGGSSKGSKKSRKSRRTKKKNEEGAPPVSAVERTTPTPTHVFAAAAEERKSQRGEGSSRSGPKAVAKVAKQQSESIQKKQLKRVKKNGKVIFIPHDQKVEKPLISPALMYNLVPLVVGLATVVGSIGLGVIYAQQK